MTAFADDKLIEPKLIEFVFLKKSEGIESIVGKEKMFVTTVFSLLPTMFSKFLFFKISYTICGCGERDLSIQTYIQNKLNIFRL